MKVKIKRIDPSLPLPLYHTNGACAFDIYSRLDIAIPPQEFKRVPTNLVIKVPDNCVLFTSLRSSAPQKKSLIMGNAPGIVDQDYCGPGDEIYILLYNLSNKPVEIKKGDRFAQGTFVRIDKAIWQEIKNIKSQNRGGFGSTG